MNVSAAVNNNQTQQSSSISTSPTVIIRLQNLAWEARSHDIRQFFGGLVIPDGGVHIIGGPDGDAFIAFQSDDDARKAMLKNGHQLCGNQIRLMLSSKNEMYSIIAQAKMSNPYTAMAAASAVSINSHVVQQTPPQPSASAQHQQQQHQQQPSSTMHLEQANQNSPTKILDWFNQNSRQQQIETNIIDGGNATKSESKIASTSQANKSALTPGHTNSAAQVETTRKLTVNEVQEKLSAMLNSARSSSDNSSGQHITSNLGKSDGSDSNNNERVALNFAQQLFSLLEMSTPSDGSSTTSSVPSSTNFQASIVDSNQHDISKIQNPLVNIHSQQFPVAPDQQQTFSIPGLGNPNDINHQNNLHPYQNQIFGSRNSQINPTVQQQAISSIPPPIAVANSLSNPVFPPNLASTAQIPPFSPHHGIIPPPTGHSFDMNLMTPAPPRLIRPLQHHQPSHEFQQFNPTTFLHNQPEVVPFATTHQLPIHSNNSLPIPEMGASSSKVFPTHHIINNQQGDNIGLKCAPSFCTENETSDLYNIQSNVGEEGRLGLLSDNSNSATHTTHCDNIQLSNCTNESDVTEPFLKISNLSNTFTYKVIHQLFYPTIKIRLRDIKILNDPNGQRTGVALISFISMDETITALRLLMERIQGNIGVFPSSEYEYVCSVDSYMSAAMRKRASEGFYAIRIIGFPFKWDKRDIRKYFEGVNFHSRDKIQILETDYRNSAHNIAIALMASQLDLERAMFYDGEETGHGKLTINPISKEQVELETSSARYRQQQNRERSGSQSNIRGGGSSSHNSTFYESRSRRNEEENRSYSSSLAGADRSNTISSSANDQAKRFRSEDDVTSSIAVSGSPNGTIIRLSGFPVLYTENDMRNLLVRAQLIPNTADAAAAYLPMPEVNCSRDKDTNKLTGVVLVKFADANTCRKALGRARHVLTAKSIESEIITNISSLNSMNVLKDAKRSRVDRPSDVEEYHRSSGPGTEGRLKESRFSSSEKFTSPRPDYDDRRRSNLTTDTEHRYRTESRFSVGKSNDGSKLRPRREYEKRDLTSRFDHIDSSTPVNENQSSLTDSHAFPFNIPSVNSGYPQGSHQQVPTTSDGHVEEGKSTTAKYPVQTSISSATPTQTANKRPLLPDPVTVPGHETLGPNNTHGNPVMPTTMPPISLPSASKTNTALSNPPTYINATIQQQSQPQCLNPASQHLMIPPVQRAPLNLPPIPSELNHLVGQILLLDNVPFRATKEDICGWLSRFHPIENTLKIRHDDSGRPTGHAIVALQSRQDADVACSVLRGIPLLGRHIQTLIM